MEQSLLEIDDQEDNTPLYEPATPSKPPNLKVTYKPLAIKLKRPFSMTDKLMPWSIIALTIIMFCGFILKPIFFTDLNAPKLRVISGHQ